MKPDKTETTDQTLDRLFIENGLLKEDWFISSQYRILKRQGIEKIQYKNNVQVDFESVTMTPGFCVVKATAIKRIDTNHHLQVQTFGSAGFNADGNYPKNKGNQYLYFPEMAEKRALSRAILKVCGFYELGVFGEDESENFKNRSEVIDSAEANTDTGKMTALIALTKVASRKALADAYSFHKAQFGADLDFIRLLQIVGERYPKPIEQPA